MAKHSYLTETRSLLRTLRKHKIRPAYGESDGDRFQAEAEELTAQDECRLVVYFGPKPEVKHVAQLLLILGNSPGELVADWTIPADADHAAALDAATDEHYNRWSK